VRAAYARAAQKPERGVLTAASAAILEAALAKVGVETSQHDPRSPLFRRPGSGGDQAAFGGGTGTWLEISVQESPPPRAFCTGQRQAYWPWNPPLPVCHYGEPPMLGRRPRCRVLPLSPPVFSAKACGWTRHQMQAYLGQLRAAGPPVRP